MKKILIVALLLIAAGCKGRKLTASSPAKFTAENLAEVIKADNLANIYSESEIIEGTDLFEEGTVERPYTILYPESADEMLIIWGDSERTELHQLRFEKEGRWTTKNGIEIGTSYEDLVSLNENPIKVYGFGWDYSGAVDWNNGKLANSNVRVFLAPEGTPPNKFIGDRVIEPDPEELKTLGLKVRAVILQK